MKQILGDPLFKNGFMLCHTNALITREPIKILDYCGTAAGKPQWKIAQWGSRYNLANGSEFACPDASYEYRDEGKSLRVYPGKGKISLSLSASKEYERPRKESESWPHILLEQEFPEKIRLCETEEIVSEVSFAIDKYRSAMTPEERTLLHTAQFQWFIAVRNENEKSEGFGDFFWFGLPFWDYPRYDFPPAFRAVDGGKEEHTGKFIDIIDGREILDKPITLGENTNISVPIFERIREGFDIAKKNGFLKTSGWEDMYLGNTNIGFEVTGTFDVEVTINNINIFIKEGKKR